MMPKTPKEQRYDQATLIMARTLYPTALGCGGAPYTPVSAIDHTRRAIRALRNAGFIIVRDRLGADIGDPLLRPAEGSK